MTAFVSCSVRGCSREGDDARGGVLGGLAVTQTADVEKDALASAREMIGVPLYEETSEFPVEKGYIWTSCSSVENGNPLFWDEDVARAVTGGHIAPPSMISVWFRPHHWAPGRDRQLLPLQVHFDLKEKLGLPEAVMTDDTIVFYEPVRVGDVLHTRQVLRSVSDAKTTKLGTGRFWVIDVEYENQRDELVGVETYTGFGYVKDDAQASTPSPSSSSSPPPPTVSSPVSSSPESSSWARASEAQGPPPAEPAAAQAAVTERSEASEQSDAIVPRLFLAEVAAGDVLPGLTYEVSATTVVLGALATRDWRPMHHDKDFAVHRNGTRDIFLNTPNQAAWFERYLTDWTGPHGRLGRMRFTMRGSVFPGDTMTLSAVVDEAGVDEVGCGWVGVDITLAVDGAVKTTCDARVAVPVDRSDNPWTRKGDRWRP
jgi:acyl dehydratase